MAKFRKRPIVIEAVRWAPGVAIKGVDEVPSTVNGVTTIEAHVHTLNGVVVAQEGEWIITGVRGEVYPCAPDIFQATYEPVPDAKK